MKTTKRCETISPCFALFKYRFVSKFQESAPPTICSSNRDTSMILLLLSFPLSRQLRSFFPDRIADHETRRGGKAEWSIHRPKKSMRKKKTENRQRRREFWKVDEASDPPVMRQARQFNSLQPNSSISITSSHPIPSHPIQSTSHQSPITTYPYKKPYIIQHTGGKKRLWPRGLVCLMRHEAWSCNPNPASSRGDSSRKKITHLTSSHLT